MGAADFLTTLVTIFPVETIPGHLKGQLLTNAVMSDCPKTFAIIYPFMNAVQYEEIVNIATERGNSEIMDILLPNSKVETEEEKMNLKTSILNKTASLFNLVPKFVEFIYNEKIDKMKLLLTGSPVTYDSLLQLLHIPTIHVGVTKDGNVYKACIEDCSQKKSCERMREVFSLVKIIIGKLGEINPVFKEILLTIIGSVREGSRVFYPDEIDLHLSLSEAIKPIFYFEHSTQRLMFKPDHKTEETIRKYKKINDELKGVIYNVRDRVLN